MKKKISHRKKRTPKLKQTRGSKMLLPLIVLTVVAFGAIIWRSLPKAVPVDINLVGSSTGTISLALTPATLSLNPNTESTISLKIDAGTTHATIAQVELTYDESKLGTPVVTQGDFFNTALVEATVGNGKINFVYGASTDSGGITGQGTLATIKIKPTVVGSSSINFTENTLISNTETSAQRLNVLSSAGNATIQVATTEVVSSPAPTPSLSPSAPASPTPSPIVEKPSRPTNLLSNCFDGGNKITLRWNAVIGASSYKVRLDQKDGSGDKSIDGITRTEHEFSIIPDQKYSWWVHATKDGVDSEEAKVNEVVCTKPIAVTPTVPIRPSPTVTPTRRAVATPTPTPVITLRPSPVSLPKPSNIQTAPTEIDESISDLSDLNQFMETNKGTVTETKRPPTFLEKLFTSIAKFFQNLL